MRPDIHRPASLAAARDLMAGLEGCRWLAGGTDLLVKIRGGRARPGALVSIRGLEELRGMEIGPGGASIGAAVTFAEILEHRALCAAYPGLAQAASLVGNVQVRNAATLGGNLANASPCADSAPALLALEAKLAVSGPRGERAIDVEQLFAGPKQTCLLPDELIARVLLPPAQPECRALFFKKRRVHVDLALASLALYGEVRNGRVARLRLAAGAVAPTPLRLRRTEALIEGKAIEAGALDAACALAQDEVHPISDVRCSADYRRHLVAVFLRRGLEALVEKDTP